MRPGAFSWATQMAPKLDSQGWIDATYEGRDFAYAVRDDRLWVRYQGKYKCTQVGSSGSISAIRALAELLIAEQQNWMDDTHAKWVGVPSE